jgi:hypothetical protein
MYNHVSYHLEDSKIILEEINKDYNTNWYHPKGRPTGLPGTGDFDYGRMKFVNRNLNYFYFRNMVSHAVKNDYNYNPNYTNLLNFCNKQRTILNENGPFGRMCIWKLDAKGYLLPHIDNWEYHRYITRYIFCVSEHAGAEALIKIEGTTIDVRPGLCFSFYPCREKHEFVNHTDRPWYFIGFDYWNLDKLSEAIINENITKDTAIPYSEGYGAYNSQAKYMSPE